MNYAIGSTYHYPNSKKQFKLISTDTYIFKFECGHWCTDNVFCDLINSKTKIQNYMNNQLNFF